MREVWQWTEKQLDEIDAEAQALVDRYWDWHFQHNDRFTDWAEKSRLGVRVRRNKNGIAIDWYVNRWVRRDRGVRTFSDHIARGKGADGYPPGKLERYAQSEEEQEVVAQYEERFKALRRRVRKLATLRQELRKYAKEIGCEDEIDRWAQEGLEAWKEQRQVGAST